MAKITTVMRNLIINIIAPLVFWICRRIQDELKKRGYQYVPSIKGIKNLITKFKKTKSTENKKKKSIIIITDEGLTLINQMIREDREIYARSIQRKLIAFMDIKVSLETIRKTVLNLGWKKTQTRYCQMIRHVNRAKRLAYAHLCMSTNEHFEDCIFTDESSIQLDNNGNLRFRRNDEPAVYGRAGKPKHPLKVHVWAGISRKGATDIVIFTGILDAVGLEVILRTSLLPFIRANFPDGHRFLQDNDPKHMSQHIKNFMEDNSINHWNQITRFKSH